jgi:threonine dehydratase
VHFDEQWINIYKYAGYCGQESGVHIVREEFLDEAVRLAESQMISCEPSGIAGLAMMLQMQKNLPRNKKILIVNTGKTKL